MPGAAIPGVLAPTIFFLGLTAVFGSLHAAARASTPTRYQSFLIPVSLMQGAGFTGAATGVNLARDIEQGWFDRLLASPAPRPVLLAGLVLSASLRALVPATVLLIIGFSLGVGWPGIAGLLLALRAGDGHRHRRGLLGLHARAQVQVAVGGAADAGRGCSSSSCSRPPTRRSSCCSPGCGRSPRSTR